MKPSYYKNKEVVSSYEAERFKTHRLTKEYLDVIERGFVAKWAKGNVLDVGCGTGRMSFLSNYIGLDFSDEMIKEAIKLHPYKQFAHGDATKIPFKDNYFDTVISFRLLMHLKDWKKAFKEMMRVCKKGGIIIIDVKTKLLFPQNLIRKNKINLISLNELPHPEVVFDFPPKLPLTKLLVIRK